MADSYFSLGTTAAGTEVGYYYLPGEQQTAAVGTQNMVAIFEWLETTLGPYPFGGRVASVSVDWGAGGFGGMEHHPLWHVARAAMGDQSTHAHEAAHGWFGNGIRIACWEDFVLSEGTVSYLAARSIEASVSEEAAQAVWDGYSQRLANVVSLVAWPEGCGDIDIIEDGLFSSAPYMKGAFFFRALAASIGKDTLDAVLGSFFMTHRGQAATMQMLLDAVALDTGFDATICADEWLRATSLPTVQDTCDR